MKLQLFALNAIVFYIDLTLKEGDLIFSLAVMHLRAEGRHKTLKTDKNQYLSPQSHFKSVAFDSVSVQSLHFQRKPIFVPHFGGNVTGRIPKPS